MAGRKIQNVRLSEAMDMYFKYMQDCNLKPNTVATAKSALRAFEHVIGNKIVRNIDWQDVTTYFQRRQARHGALAPLNPNSTNLQLHRMKMFFEWAVRFHYMDSDTDPMYGRHKIKVVPQHRARVEPEQFPALLDATPNPRDRIVIALGLYTMMRSGEIRGVRIGDVSMSDLSMRITRFKVSGTDDLAICQELRDELANWFMWYSQNVGRELDNDWYLVPSNVRRAPTKDPATGRFEVSQDLILAPTRRLPHNKSAPIVKRALDNIGWVVTEREGGHTLRRSAARALFESLRGNGFDDALMTVMSWLGHKKPETTMIYLGLEREAERRNKIYKGKVMYPRAVRQQQFDAGTVVPLRAVGGVGE